MKVHVHQLLFHEKQPVLSADFQTGADGRLATGGCDKYERLWRARVVDAADLT